jgi:hypothetical protein
MFRKKPMKPETRTMHAAPKLLSALLLLGSLPLAHAATVTLNDWTETGRDLANTFTANGTAGFTEVFSGGYVRSPTSTVYDSGAIASFASDVTLDATTYQLQFSFTVGSILATGAGSNNMFRVGFENDGASSVDATVHYQFGYGPPGNRLDARFAGASGSANEYSQGTAFDNDPNVAGATALDTGNTSNITVTLTYLGDAGGGNHDYQAETNWDGIIHSSSTFTRNTDTWDKVYVNMNSPAVNVLDDTYTVSNVQVTTIPEPSAVSLAFAALGGLLLRRRRQA